MKRITLIEGRDPVEFAQAYNEVVERLAGYELGPEKFISDTSMYLFYESDEDPDEDIENLRQRAEAAFKEREPDFVVDATEADGPTITLRIDLTVNVQKDRYCCECENYKWGRGCPYRDGMVRNLDRSCPMFNIVLSRR